MTRFEPAFRFVRSTYRGDIARYRGDIGEIRAHLPLSTVRVRVRVRVS